MWVIDLNRQSLDRVVPGVSIEQLKGHFGRRLARDRGQVRTQLQAASRDPAARRCGPIDDDA